DKELAGEMSAAGMIRAEEFAWPRVAAKVDDYYGFVIRRLAAQGALPPGFHAEIPPTLRLTSGQATTPDGALRRP
ncbi:MAG: hypothetical protein ABIV26_01935, partial [Candidatus Limnocylindrales bacterium]